jgi:hypothetical protein
MGDGVIVTATIVSMVIGGVVITMSSLATVLIPVPRPPEQPVIRAPADPEAV